MAQRDKIALTRRRNPGSVYVGGTMAQIESLFNQALEKSKDERARFLDESCSDDPAIRREVESLLANEEMAATFLESDAAEARSLRDRTLSGAHIAPSTVIEPLRAGGMGVACSAHGHRLDR